MPLSTVAMVAVENAFVAVHSDRSSQGLFAALGSNDESNAMSIEGMAGLIVHW